MEKEPLDVEGGIRGRFGTMQVNCTSTLEGHDPGFHLIPYAMGTESLINKVESLLRQQI